MAEVEIIPKVITSHTEDTLDVMKNLIEEMIKTAKAGAWFRGRLLKPNKEIRNLHKKIEFMHQELVPIKIPSKVMVECVTKVPTKASPTVRSNLKRKRSRLTREQSDVLNMVWENQKCIKPEKAEELKIELNLEKEKILKWFRNKRSRECKNVQ